MQSRFHPKKIIGPSSCLTWLILGLLLTCPSFLAHTGLCFKQVFERGELKCTTEYRLTGGLPIHIKRTYQDGRTEFIVIKKIQPKNAKALYELVCHSRAHLQLYMPSIVENLGTSEPLTKQYIQRDLHLMYLNQGLTLGIFFKTEQEGPERLIGQVGVHSYGYYRQGSVEGMYWVGDFQYIQAKGVAGIAIQAVFNHLITIGTVKWVNLVMCKGNSGSQQIAIRLGMKPIDPKSYKQWGYAEKREEVYAYSLPTGMWKAKYWE